MQMLLLVYSKQLNFACVEATVMETELCQFPPSFPVDHIFKESNYVYSLSLAVITHTVARGCLDGLIKNCICSGSQTSSDGCSNYTEYGLDIAEQFLSKRQAVIGGGLQSYVATHNLLAAKMVSECNTSLVE